MCTTAARLCLAFLVYSPGVRKARAVSWPRHKRPLATQGQGAQTSQALTLGPQLQHPIERLHTPVRLPSLSHGRSSVQAHPDQSSRTGLATPPSEAHTSPSHRPSGLEIEGSDCTEIFTSSRRRAGLAWGSFAEVIQIPEKRRQVCNHPDGMKRCYRDIYAPPPDHQTSRSLTQRNWNYSWSLMLGEGKG